MSYCEWLSRPIIRVELEAVRTHLSMPHAEQAGSAEIGSAEDLLGFAAVSHPPRALLFAICLTLYANFLILFLALAGVRCFSESDSGMEYFAT